MYFMFVGGGLVFLASLLQLVSLMMTIYKKGILPNSQGSSNFFRMFLDDTIVYVGLCNPKIRTIFLAASPLKKQVSKICFEDGKGSAMTLCDEA